MNDKYNVGDIVYVRQGVNILQSAIEGKYYGKCTDGYFVEYIIQGDKYIDIFTSFDSAIC